MTDIVLVNQTSVLSDWQVAAVLPAMQTLFDRDFEPVWATRLAFRLSALPSGGIAPPRDCWPIYLQDTTDEPNAGGYHEDQGLPFGKVFVRDAMEANESWTVDLSHELLEMATDPTTDVLIALPSMPGFYCLRECGDAVEDDALGYDIGGVRVTDFVTPEYFFQSRPGGYAGRAGQYDLMGHIRAPAPALLHGGYLGIRNPDGMWGSVSMFRRNGKPSRRAMRTHGRLNRIAAKGMP